MTHNLDTVTQPPPEAPTVVAGAVGYTIAAGQKFMEEKRDIALSDMYFLWQAQEYSKNHK